MRTPILLAVAVVLAAHGLARAQEIEPRSYSPGPVGMNFAGLSVLDTRGGVAVDPTLPLDNVDVRLESVMPGYSRSFGLAGRARKCVAGGSVRLGRHRGRRR